jgi:hypothetical protein
MATDWEDGKLVLSLELPYGAGYSDQFLLKPLGLSVTGVGCDVQVPGSGLVDLHQVPDPGRVVDLGQVEVTGPQAGALLGELISEAPDLREKFGSGAGAIVFMDVGDDIVTRLSNAGLSNVQLSSQLGDVINDVLGFGGGPVMRTAMCRQHRRPEICPFQH